MQFQPDPESPDWLVSLASTLGSVLILLIALVPFLMRTAGSAETRGSRWLKSLLTSIHERLSGHRDSSRHARKDVIEKYRELDVEATERRPDDRRPDLYFAYVRTDPQGHVVSERLLTEVEPLVRQIEPSLLEFRFQLATTRKGITPDEDVTIQPPPDVEFPLQLEIAVWSDDFEIPTSKDQITLPRTGDSTVAKFRLTIPRDVVRRGHANLFVFVRHEDCLLAVFRVKSRVSAEPYSTQERTQESQLLYLTTDWFTFPDGGSLAECAGWVVLYFRVEDGKVQLFVLSDSRPWKTTGATVEALRQQTMKFYRAIYCRARMAGYFESKEKSLGLHDSEANAHTLAELGWQTFARLFHIDADDDVAVLAGQVAQLPVGSIVTVAIEETETTRNLPVPWGLLYSQPVAHTGVQQDLFWGTRFKLMVRPNYKTPRHEDCATPPTFGAVYLKPQSAEMLGSVADLVARRRLASIAELPIRNGWIPSLMETEQDLLHFCCHGHTDLKDDTLRRELHAEFIQYLEQIGDADAVNEYKEAAPDVMYLGDDNASESCIKNHEGTARYSVMWFRMRRRDQLPPLVRAPIVLLSMCESAQVSYAGDSFVTSFLSWGARAVVGTEGPNVWGLAKQMDTRIIDALLNGIPLRDAVWQARRELVRKNLMAMIYVPYGDGTATLRNLGTRRPDEPLESQK